jgi:hypothetical protein
MQKHNKLLLILFILVVLTRLIPINYSYSEDEMNLPIILEGPKFVDTTFHAHPPLGQIFYKFFSLIFGTSLVAIRLFPILTSILNIYLLYLIAFTFYNNKIALYSLMLSLLSFHLLVTSSLVSIDPLSLTATLFFIYFLQRETVFDNKFTLLFGSILGISMLLKYHFLILYPILGIYLCLVQKDIKKPILQMLKITTISILIFSIFPIASYFTDPGQFNITLSFISDYTDLTYTHMNMPFGSVFIFLAIFTTPLFIGLALLQAFKLEKKDLLHIVLISTTLLFYLFAVKRGDYSRYLITILPSLIILSSAYIANLNLNIKSLKLLSTTSIITLLSSFLFSLYLLPSTIIPLKNFSSYFTLFRDLNLNFLFPLHIDHGYWISINFALLLIILIAMFILFILSIASNKKLSLLFLTLFIGIGIGHNIYLGSEYLFHVSQPNPDAAIKDMFSYYEKNSLVTPVYTNDKAFLYTLNLHKNFIIQEDSARIEDIQLLKSQLQEHPGTILYLNFAARVTKEDILSLPNCTTLRTFYSKGIPTSYVLECN